MAIAKVNKRDVLKLVSAQLATTADVHIVNIRQPEPEEIGVWARLVSVEMEELPRHTPDGHPDEQRLIVTIGVYATGAATKADAGAVERAVSRVVAATSHKAREGNGHHVQLWNAADAAIAPPVPSRATAASGIILTGSAQRLSGDSVE